MRRQSVKQIIVYKYYFDHPEETKTLDKIDLFIHKRKPNWRDDMSYNKTVNFGKDSTIYGLTITLEPTDASGSEILNFRYIINARTDEKSFTYDYRFFNETTKIASELRFRKDEGIEKPSSSEISTWYSTDSVEHYRDFQISNGVIDEFKDYFVKNTDSLTYNEVLPISTVKKHSTLTSSIYRSIICLSKENNIYSNLTVDTTYIDGELKVKKQINDYFSSTIINDSGLQVFIEYPLNKQSYREKHFKDNEELPVYEVHYKMDTVTKDTTYSLEMKSEPTKKGKVQTYKVLGSISKKKDSLDRKIPITKREVQIYTDKNENVIKYHSISYTDQGHKLEYKYTINPYKDLYYEREALIDQRTIPEISGNQNYDLQKPRDYISNWSHGGGYPKLNAKEIRKKEARIEAWEKLERPKRAFYKGIHKISKSIEKDRKNNFEKRIFNDGYNELIYHIWYFED
jgi:hypothetical protein